MIKQRFVGFVVLVAIAVIFWPIVFVTPENADDFELPVFEMPPKPVVAVSERREPVLNKVDQSVLPKVQEREPPIIQPIDIASPAPDLALVDADEEPERQLSALERADFDDQGLPVSWELQVATFSTAERAEEIALELRNKGHKAYVSILPLITIHPATVPTLDILKVSRISAVPVTSSRSSGDNMPSMASFKSLMAS